MQSDRGRKRNENFLRPSRQLEKQQKQAAGPKTPTRGEESTIGKVGQNGGQANAAAAAEATGTGDSSITVVGLHSRGRRRNARPRIERNG